MTTLGSKLGTNSWGQYFNPTKFDYATFKVHWDYLIKMANQMPLNWLRIGYTYYDDGLNSDGSYNFERLDYAIETAKEKGFKIILPIWCVNDGLTSFNSTNYNTYLTKWADMIQAIVYRCIGKGIYYEAADEALSGGHFWFEQSLDDSKISDIVNLNTRFYKLISALDSSAKFINGDVASSDNVSSAMSKGMFNFGDYVSYHVYLTNPESILTNGDQLNFIQNLKDTGMTLSCSEFGFGYPSNFNGANTREQQASKTLREIFILDMLGFEQIIQFTMEDSDSSWTFEDQNGSFNLNGELFQNLMFELRNYEFSKKIDSDNGDYILKYVSDGNVDKFVYWTTNGSHSANGYDFTDTPQIMTANKNSGSKINPVTLDALTDLNIVSNFQENLSTIQESLSDINSFLSMFGFPTQSIPELADLTSFDVIDRAFAQAYLNNISLISSTIQQVIDIFENESWLGYGTYSRFTNPTPLNKANINLNWQTLELNINQLISIINEVTV